jgi:hypothetical protein
MLRVARRKMVGRQNISDLYLLLALLGLPIVVLLFWLLQSANPNWAAQVFSLFPGATASRSVNSLGATNGANIKVLQPTHRAICESGRDSLNLRPSASFSPPIAVIPCGEAVAITGAPVWRDGESWSPLAYRNVQGWSVSRLLRKI